MPRTKKIDDATILRMSLAAIIEKGATVFSLEDIRKKTGLSPATLLQRFGSKEKILLGAMALANADLSHDLENRSLGDKNPLQEIIDIYLELAHAFKSPIDIANGLDILKYDITDPALNGLTRNYFYIRRKKIRSLILLAQEKKKLTAKIDASELVWDLESLWQGSIMLWALTGHDSLQDWLKHRFLSFFRLCG